MDVDDIKFSGSVEGSELWRGIVLLLCTVWTVDIWHLFFLPVDQVKGLRKLNGN